MIEPVDPRTLPPDAQAARTFAVEAHRTQSYGTLPYVSHLDDVAAVLLSIGRGDLLVEGYLHDVVEDAPHAAAELARRFPEAVPVVEAVSGRGESRQARVEDIARKIRGDERAQTLKAADRVANMERSAGPQGDAAKARMYARECPAFLASVPLAPPVLRLWIEGLARMVDGAEAVR